MLTPPSPHFPEVPQTDDPPGSDPDREPRKEPEPDVGEPLRSLKALHSPTGGTTAERR